MIAKVRRYFEGISDRDVMLILIGFFFGAVGVSVSAHFLSRDVNMWVWLDSFTQNFGTEMFGGFLTFLLIEVVRGSRREREAAEREAEELKRELIRKMGSNVRDVAVPAVEELRVNGWLYDGTLTRISLAEANLQGSWLEGANLQKVNLWGADLQEAGLVKANLQRANLSWAKLQGADLRDANLRGARLGGANLQGADLQDAVFDDDTTLPDGTKWTPDTDLARFTDPAHPNFWRSDEPDSPAYRGDNSESQEA